MSIYLLLVCSSHFPKNVSAQTGDGRKVASKYGLGFALFFLEVGPPTPYYNVAATQIDKRGGRFTRINVAS